MILLSILLGGIMPEKPNALHTLGIELSTHALRAVELTLRKGSPALEKLYELPFESSASPTPDHVNQLYANGEGPQLQQVYEKALVVTALETQEVLVRPLEVKLKKESDIDDVLAFQTEPLLPYPVENALVDRVKTGETADGTLLTVLAARKDHVQEHLQRWNTLLLEPEIVTAVPIALTAFASLFAPTETPQFLVHLGSTATTCCLVRGGKLLAAQACSSNIDTLAKAYEADHKGSAHSAFETLDFSKISAVNHPQLTQVLENLQFDITRTAYALAKQTKGQEIPAILATGEGATLQNLATTLCKSLNKILLTPTTTPGFDLSPSHLQKWALPIGAALTGLPSYRDPVNLRQADLAYPHPWKRYKLPVAIYLALCAGLAIALAFMGSAYVKYKEDQVRQEYSQLLSSMHKPYTEFEKEYALKTGRGEIQEAPLVQSLNLDEIRDRLRYLDKELQSTPEIYPLLPNIPNVSDVLAWLSSHPNAVSIDPKTGEKNPLLQIESFSYALVKRPDVTKKQEKYQVKIELEFSSPTPKLAREFHDSLIAPNAFVDPKGEVKWSTNRGLYRASFFLKDRTVYPTAS